MSCLIAIAIVIACLGAAASAEAGNPPSVTIQKPSGVYQLGQRIETEFTCTEGQEEPGLTSCEDENGEGLNFASPGLVFSEVVQSFIEPAHSGEFEYHASTKSNDGLSDSAVAKYVVEQPLSPGTTSCNGIYDGAGTEVLVPKGALCTLVAGTTVSKNVRVQPGGSLVAEGANIKGNVIAQDPLGLQFTGQPNVVGENLQVVGLSGDVDDEANLICNTHIGGNLLISGTSADVGPIQVGGEFKHLYASAHASGAAVAGQVVNPDCPADTVRLDVNVSANAAAVEIDGDDLEHEVLLSNNSAPVELELDQIGGSLGVGGDKALTAARRDVISHSLTAQRNSGELSIEEDEIGGNLSVRNNTAPASLSDDSTRGRGECANNKPPASGAANTFNEHNSGCPT